MKELTREIVNRLYTYQGKAADPHFVAITDRVLADLGVKRVSIGVSLARATFGLIRRAAAEIREHGTFNFAQDQVPDAELCRFFASRPNRTSP